MTIEALLQSPEAYIIAVAAWMLNWLLKLAVQNKPIRKDPNFKLLLSVLPLCLGAALGYFLFVDLEGSTEATRALAGAGAAAPAVVSYSTIKQISQLSWLPAQAKALLAILLQRSKDLEEKPPVPPAVETEESQQ